LEKGFQVLVLA
jgi:hypothetical protein